MAETPETRGKRPSRRGGPAIGLPVPLVADVDGLAVVRDDELQGGVLGRAAWRVLRQSQFAEIAIGANGGDPALLALAYWARVAGKRARLFVPQLATPHRVTIAAYRAGAFVEQVAGGLDQARAAAAHYAAGEPCELLPPGLDMPEAVAAIAAAARGLELLPAEVWTADRTGVVTRGLQAAWPYARHVVVLVDGQQCDTGQAFRIVESLPLDQPADVLPPFPASPECAAKAWRHVHNDGGIDALLWNTF